MSRGNKFTKGAAQLGVFLFVVIGWFYFRDSLQRFCFDERLLGHRWPHLSNETRDSLKTLWKVGNVIAVASLVLEFLFKPEGIASTLRAVADFLTQRTGLIRAPLRNLTSLVRPRLKVPKRSYYMPGERWWEDVPLFLLFVWLAAGPPHLVWWVVLGYTRLTASILPPDFPFPSAEIFVGLPMFLSFFALGFTALFSLPMMMRAAGLAIRGLWRDSTSGYWAWLKAEIRKADAIFGGAGGFELPSNPYFEKREVKLSHRLVVYGFLLVFIWLIWPGIAFLYLVSVALWFVAILLFLLAEISSVGLRYGRLPRVAPAIGVTNLLIGCWLGLI